MLVCRGRLLGRGVARGRGNVRREGRVEWGGVGRGRATVAHARWVWRHRRAHRDRRLHSPGAPPHATAQTDGPASLVGCCVMRSSSSKLEEDVLSELNSCW
eukprot:scaffold222499_cov32-Tisochrysis_lutea.AAC.1